MRYLLIANPASGAQGLPVRADRVDRVVEWFRQRGDEVEARRTRGPGDATRLAREAEGFDAVIAAGGDGTVNEVLNGLAGGSSPLGILPWGTGNVFAKEMGFPRGLRRCCRVIRRGLSARLDVGRCGERRFLMMAGAGIDAYALGRMRGKNWKRLFGVAGYAVGALLAFARYRDAEIGVFFPDGRSLKGSYVLVSNTRLYGGIFAFAPTAVPTDGLLDVFVFRGKSRWGLLGFLVRRILLPRRLFRGGVLVKTASVELRSAAPVPLQVDGDLFAPLPRTLSVEPASLSVLLPKRTLKRLEARSRSALNER